MDVQISDAASSSFTSAASAIGLSPPPPPPQSSAPLAAPAPIDTDAAAAPAPSIQFGGNAPSGSTQGARGGTPLHVESSLGDTAGRIYHSPRPLSVEFHSTSQPNEIVTILRDPSTGQVYAEFPSDAVVRLAEFFQHLAGFVVDQKA